MEAFIEVRRGYRVRTKNAKFVEVLITKAAHDRTGEWFSYWGKVVSDHLVSRNSDRGEPGRAAICQEPSHVSMIKVLIHLHDENPISLSPTAVPHCLDFAAQTSN